MAKKSLIYGFHAVRSRLRQHPDSLLTLYVEADRDDVRAREFRTWVETLGIVPHWVSSERLDRLCGTHRHQGVVAEVEVIQPVADLDGLVETAGADLLLLVLDGIQDPHNLGACLRVADAMGAQAVIAPRDRAVSLSPTVSKVASGAAETVPFLAVTNLSRTLQDLKDFGVWVVGTDDQATEPLTTVSSSGPIAWVLGAEGGGLRRLTRETCDQRVRIPMWGQVESLNVSVAAGICLYETRRQRPPTTVRPESPMP